MRCSVAQDAVLLNVLTWLCCAVLCCAVVQGQLGIGSIKKGKAADGAQGCK
jgi:hypothetical protein